MSNKIPHDIIIYPIKVFESNMVMNKLIGEIYNFDNNEVIECSIDCSYYYTTNKKESINSADFHFNLKDYDENQWIEFRKDFLYGLIFIEHNVNLHIYVDDIKTKENILQIINEQDNINLITMEE